MEKCKICGIEHDNKCFLIKAVEFYKDGKLKRIEYLTPADYTPTQHVHQLEPHGTRQ